MKLDTLLRAAEENPTTENIRSLSIALYSAMVCAHEFGRYPDEVDHRKVVHLSLWERWHFENKDALERLLTPYALTAGEAGGNVFPDIIEGNPHSETHLSNFPPLAGDNNPGTVSETAERLVNGFMKDRLFILRVKEHMAKEEPAPAELSEEVEAVDGFKKSTWKKLYETITGRRYDPAIDKKELHNFRNRVKSKHWEKLIFPTSDRKIKYKPQVIKAIRDDFPHYRPE